MNLWKYRFAKTISTSKILTLGATKKSGRRVLMYHSIRDTDINPEISTVDSSIDTVNIYVLSRTRFAQHVALLARHNTAGDRLVVPLESELETVCQSHSTTATKTPFRLQRLFFVNIICPFMYSSRLQILSRPTRSI